VTVRTKEELAQANELTTREKIAMTLLVMMFRVLSPTKWEHKITEPLKQIQALIKETAR